jgi:hypothetical protein
MDKGFVFLGVIAAMLLSGCSGGQATLSKAEKDKIYLETVRDEYPKSAAVKDDRLMLQLAEASCSAFDSGASKADIIDSIRAHGGNAGVEIGYAVGVAVPIYCPEHDAKL